jgi:AcrR family transcriptional regulator
MKTKDKILKTAGLLFSQRGYFAVSMQDVANKVGISKPALYYYFKSKNDLCRSLLESSSKDLLAKLTTAVQKGRTPTDKLFNLIVAYLNFSLKRPEINLVFKEGFEVKDGLEKFILNLRLQILSLFKKVINKAIAQADKPFAHLSLTTSLLASLLSRPIFLVHTTPKQLARNIIELFFPSINKESLARQ